MDHMKLTDELRAVLIESAAFVKTERAPLIEESAAVVEETPEVVSDEVEETEVVEESEEVHACPLCCSQLSESIDEDRLLDHLNVVMGLVDRLSQINEGDEDIDTVIADAVAELLLADEDEA